MAKNEHDNIFVITFRDHKDGHAVTLKAKKVTDSSLGLSFVAISDFVFDSESLVVNPAEEDLKRRFASVKTLHLSIYSILSIEEVGRGHKGLSFAHDKSKLLVLPGATRSPKDT
ncbi:MAG: DUF1820 family protein [Desulfobacterota bacterium]|nr:DUF1820 family protein [Thermodesulfobacteriota bacterium]